MIALMQMLHQLHILLDLLLVMVFGGIGGAIGATLIFLWFWRGPLDQLQDSCCRQKQEELAEALERLRLREQHEQQQRGELP